MKRFALAILMAAGSLSSGAFANTVTDFTFDSVPLGNAVPTTAPNVDPQPQHTVYSTGGFPDSGPLTGTVTVQNVGGLNHAAVMSTNQGGIGSLFMDTQFLTPGPRLVTDFDIDVITTPERGLPQGDAHDPNGQAFAINAFDLSSNRAWRFVVSPTSSTGGEFAMRDNAGGDVIPFGSYTNGDTHHITIDLNDVTGTVDVSLDHVLALAGIPIVTPGTGLSELFFFQNGVEGVQNTVALDNIELTSVPLPSAVWGGLGLIGLLAANKARKLA